MGTETRKLHQITETRKSHENEKKKFGENSKLTGLTRIEVPKLWIPLDVILLVSRDRNDGSRLQFSKNEFNFNVYGFYEFKNAKTQKWKD